MRFFMVEITIEDITISLDTFPAQEFKNVTVIPIKSVCSINEDILTLKKGLSLGLVEITECNPSTVGEILVKNDSIAPLILVDGEEIVGAKQNRIINSTILIPPVTTSKVSVSCTEQGRWEYKNSDVKFSQSKYFANSNTRRLKSMNLYDNAPCQNMVWDSINELEEYTKSRSPTSALNDTYENINHNEIINHFKCLDGQIGLIIVFNNEILGLELFASSWLYSDFHEKIIRSYLIDNINSNIDSNKTLTGFSGSKFNHLNYDIDIFLANISLSNFKRETNVGLGDTIKFSNIYGTGSSLIYKDNIIYLNYFKKKEAPHFYSPVDFDLGYSKPTNQVLY